MKAPPSSARPTSAPPASPPSPIPSHSVPTSSPQSSTAVRKPSHRPRPPSPYKSSRRTSASPSPQSPSRCKPNTTHLSLSPHNPLPGSEATSPLPAPTYRPTPLAPSRHNRSISQPGTPPHPSSSSTPTNSTSTSSTAPILLRSSAFWPCRCSCSTEGAAHWPSFSLSRPSPSLPPPQAVAARYRSTPPPALTQSRSMPNRPTPSSTTPSR